MSGIDLSQGGVSITDDGETASLSREELESCRHSLDVIHAFEAKLGRSLKNGYYFHYDALSDSWGGESGDFGVSRRPKEVIKEVPVIKYVDRAVYAETPVELIMECIKKVYGERVVEVAIQPTIKTLWAAWMTKLKGK